MACGLALCLIWCFRYPPFIDAANVAYSGEVMHDLWRGGGVYGKWYALREGAVSHMAYYRLYHWLRYVLPPVASTKVLITLGVVGLPLAMAGLLRSLNRTLWLSIPAFALAFNTNLNMGYLPFVIGIPLIPLCLMLIELNATQPRTWRWVLLALALLGSLWVHFFLAAVLFPLVALFAFLSFRGRLRVYVAGAITLSLSVAGLLLVGKHTMPAWRRVFQRIPFSERWDQLDRDVIQWTTDGAPALSFPWLLLAFVVSVGLVRRTQAPENGASAARGGILAAALFVAYMLGPNYISWPEPAWGFGTRIGVALAISLLLVHSTSATGWRRVLQVSPWLAFTFWHLVSLVEPFRVYALDMHPLAELRDAVPKKSKILPLYDSEWLKYPGLYSFGGFVGFVFKHAGKWLAVESTGYQPWSFCDAGYHPIKCLTQLSAPAQPSASRVSPEILESYDYVLVHEDATHARQPPNERWALDKRIGHWSLWKHDLRAIKDHPDE